VKISFDQCLMGNNEFQNLDLMPSQSTHCEQKSICSFFLEQNAQCAKFNAWRLLFQKKPKK